MGFFSRRNRDTRAAASTVVTVAFRDIAAKSPLADFSPDHGYAYMWPFPEAPQVGDWAVAPGWKGPASVIVGALGAPASAQGMDLKPLLKRIPPENVARARAEKDAAAHRWLDYAAQLAGVASGTSVTASPPRGYEPLPPSEGKADPEKANEYGRAWWRAYHLAAELDRPAEEVQVFKAAGRHWFRIRDHALKEARDERVAATVANTDLVAAIRNVRKRPRAEVEKSLFAGQPLWDWLTYVQGLEREGRLDEALQLLEALITAAEQEAEVSGREPAPAYTERAAIIHRKRRDYAGEMAVIERWAKACPPERRGSGATQAKLLKRLERARELASKP